MLRREHPRERPAEDRDLAPSPAQDHAHVHRRNPDHSLDRARVLRRVRHLNHVANRDLDLVHLNQGSHRDLDQSRRQDHAREVLRSHRRGLGRARDPSRGRGQDRDPPPVAVALPRARAVKAARKVSESKGSVKSVSFLIKSLF